MACRGSRGAREREQEGQTECGVKRIRELERDVRRKDRALVQRDLVAEQARELVEPGTALPQSFTVLAQDVPRAIVRDHEHGLRRRSGHDDGDIGIDGLPRLRGGRDRVRQARIVFGHGGSRLAVAAEL